MQQSILALGALLIVMMTAINHQRSTFLIQEVSYVREVESAAADLAEARLESILNQAVFDENTVGMTTLPSDASGMTATLGNEAGEVGPGPSDESIGLFNDIDDFHLYTQTFRHGISSDTFNFQINYSVRYVDPTNPDVAAGGPTFAKEITALVVSQDTIGSRIARVNFSKTATIADGL